MGSFVSRTVGAVQDQKCLGPMVGQWQNQC